MADDLLALFNSLDDTPVVRENFVRAPFGYPGGKSRSLEKLLPLLPYRDAYCEPFGGSGSVLLSRRPSKLEVFNDRYAGVVAFYRCIRDYKKCRELTVRLEPWLHSREEFIWCRETWKDCEDDVERAARWYYMMVMSFGQQGRHFGRSTKGRSQMASKFHNNLKYFWPCHDRLRHVQVENQDWRECLRDYDQPEMVWYLDPPYVDYSKGMYEHDVTRREHVELLERIQALQGFVALSGYQNDLYDKYPWDQKYEWEVQVSMLGMAFTDTNNLAGREEELKRGKAKEVLWIREAK